MLRVLVVIALLLSSACSQLLTKDRSLYQELGEAQGIDAMVYELLVNIAADKRIVERFRDVNVERFRTGLATYICSISDGPCDYTGDSIQTIHAGHYYTDTEFNALVDNIIKAMETRKITVSTQNRLLARLAPSYKDVIYQ